MKRLLGAVALAAMSTFGIASAAMAYPIEDATLTLAPSTVTPGATFTATLNGCELGDVVTVTVAGDSGSATCGGPVGSSRGLAAPGEASASVSLSAPTTPGSYPVSASATPSGTTASATLTVVAPGGGLPSTGGGGTGGRLPSTGSSDLPIAQIAGGTLIAGLALTGVAMYRRRSRATA